MSQKNIISLPKWSQVAAFIGMVKTESKIQERTETPRTEIVATELEKEWSPFKLGATKMVVHTSILGINLLKIKRNTGSAHVLELIKSKVCTNLSKHQGRTRVCSARDLCMRQARTFDGAGTTTKLVGPSRTCLNHRRCARDSGKLEMETRRSLEHLLSPAADGNLRCAWSIWGRGEIEEAGTRDGEGSLHAGGGDWGRCRRGTAAAAAGRCNPNPSENGYETGKRYRGCRSGWKIARQARHIWNGIVWVISA
jgi:hypothetical protein